MNSRIALAAAALITASCRLDMHDQPRYDPLQASTFFGDGRSAREIPEGTVAVGQLRSDRAFYTGKQGNQFVAMPLKVDRPLLARGQQRFNIYCSPCHGRDGDGGGMIVQRGFRQPPTFHDDRMRELPDGHYYDVITNGFGAMPSYASRIPPRDRWAITAYVRALQLGQRATVEDIPPDQRGAIGPAIPQARGAQPAAGSTGGVPAQAPAPVPAEPAPAGRQQPQGTHKQ
jgi:mono/diheme cytochrome c family protein